MFPHSEGAAMGPRRVIASRPHTTFLTPVDLQKQLLTKRFALPAPFATVVATLAYGVPRS